MMPNIPSVDLTGISGNLSTEKMEQAKQSHRREELLRASQEFESYFLSYLMKVMRETVPKGALTANHMGEMFVSFYDQEIGNQAAQAGGIGLSAYVLNSVFQNDVLTPPSASHLPSMKS